MIVREESWEIFQVNSFPLLNVMQYFVALISQNPVVHIT